jgi:hypothetical protein
MLLGVAAAAKTSKLEAKFDSDPIASLTFNVKADSKGKPTKATAINYDGLPASCDGVITRVAGTIAKAKIVIDKHGVPSFNTHTESAGVYVSIIAYFNKKGTKVVQGETNTIETNSSTDCTGQVFLEFTAK